MILIGLGALWSGVVNLREHHTYAVASRLALFGAALSGFVNPAGMERLIRERPLVAAAIGATFLVLIIGYFVLFHIVFPPPK